MKNKFMRSVTAMVVAVTMLISSQGVVTSFADGGDHSDMSESSSVQMNEVGNNGTDQSTKDDAAQCNCGATDGEAHKEGCPLYVKPDGGNTENDAAQCTCGAKEGEPHQENCPLYVKPDGGNTNNGDTDNSAGEDADIKSVVDAINALPAAGTITKETNLVSLKDQVNAARVAYDALSDDQKAAFDAATLEKLTALEAKISELESGEQETAPSEAVQNVIEKIDAAVEQIDYTTETISATDGTTVTKTHITMLKDLDPANNAELKALIDKEAAHEQDETQPALTDEEAAKLSEVRKAFEDAKAKYLSEGFSNAQLAARQAYDALAEADKTQVTNYSLLTDMETNIAYIMQAVNTLPEEPVAMIGTEPYTSLDDAVEKAEEGSTITLLKDCKLTKGFNKTLTFTGHHKITIPKQLTSNGEGWMCFGLYDPSRVLTFDDVEVEWISDGTAPWLMLSLSGTLNVTNGANLTFKFDSKTTKTRNAIYMNEGAVLNVTNASTFQILGVGTEGTAGQGIQLDKTGKSTINVSAGSTFLIDGTNRGYVNSPVVNVEDSTFTVQNCTSNASNGGNFTATNSKVTYQNNKGHGLSAGDVILKNTDFLSDNNGLYGVYVNGKFLVDKDSTMTVTNNSYDGDCAGVNLTAAVNDGRVEAGAVVTITGNKCSGFSSRGVCTFEEGSKLTITNNINDKGSASYGGGIYNTKSTAHLTLPSDAVIYNNHAVTGGDDIYNTGEITFSHVGTDWILDDTNLPITGWYFDGNNNGTTTNRWSKSNYYELFNLFDESGKVTLTGTYALKAAHAYAYDPETPVNPTDWEHSKSKTATNLDANYQSQVTLSLPAAQEQLVSDVVFVLDESSAYDAVVEEMDTMLNNLADHVAKNEAAVKVGVVVFRGNAVTKDLELLTPDSIDDINAFVRTRPDVGGSNMMAGLQAAEAMLQNAPEDDSRKYMILIGDGITYTWSGENGEQLGVNFANADAPTSPMLASPDAFDVKHGNGYLPNDWSKHLNEVSSVMEKTISEKSSSYSRGVDISTLPFIRNDEKYNYTSSVDIALYKCDQLYRNLSSKYHCYTVMRSAPSLSDPSKTDGEIHPWGPSFMNYLANGKEVSFAEIQNDIYYLLDAGSQVVDVIGEGIDNVGNEYDFKFIDEADKLTLKVGNEVLPIHEENGYYGFGEKLTSGDYAGHYPYELTYYPEGMGTRSLEVAGELFRWDINVPVSNFAPVQLTYTVQLTNPQTADGTYGQYDADGSKEYAGLYTNKMAILYPVDSNGVEGEQEAFQKPTVSYSISNGKPVDPPVDPEDPTPRPGGGGDEDDDTPTIINETPVPTTTIDDEDVPLTDLPEDTVTIDDEEVPLKDIPNTGDMIPVPAMVAAVISIGGIALLMKKHK